MGAFPLVSSLGGSDAVEWLWALPFVSVCRLSLLRVCVCAFFFSGVSASSCLFGRCVLLLLPWRGACPVSSGKCNTSFHDDLQMARGPDSKKRGSVAAILNAQQQKQEQIRNRKNVLATVWWKLEEPQ